MVYLHVSSVQKNKYMYFHQACKIGNLCTNRLSLQPNQNYGVMLPRTRCLRSTFFNPSFLFTKWFKTTKIADRKHLSTSSMKAWFPVKSTFIFDSNWCLKNNTTAGLFGPRHTSALPKLDQKTKITDRWKRHTIAVIKLWDTCI